LRIPPKPDRSPLAGFFDSEICAVAAPLPLQLSLTHDSKLMNRHYGHRSTHFARQGRRIVRRLMAL